MKLVNKHYFVYKKNDEGRKNLKEKNKREEEGEQGESDVCMRVYFS